MEFQRGQKYNYHIDFRLSDGVEMIVKTKTVVKLIQKQLSNSGTFHPHMQIKPLVSIVKLRQEFTMRANSPFACATFHTCSTLAFISVRSEAQ